MGEKYEIKYKRNKTNFERKIFRRLIFAERPRTDNFQ